MATLSLKEVTKRFPNSVEAVSNFSLDIADGEFIVLVGPSGCGKSTTLRLIAGLESITSGKLFIDGVLMNHVLPKDRDIAMVFQSYALYPHLSVYDNLAFPLNARKVDKGRVKRIVEETAELLELTPLLKRKPRELSGGQKQRVALGRAIVRKPKIFLFDEPLSNLDAKLRAQMRINILKLHQELNTTFVYVTHDQVEAMTMGSRIVVMKEGAIQQTGPPQKVYEEPANLFVAGFIGTPQMNFLDVKIAREEKGLFAVFGRQALLLPEQTAGQIASYAGRELIMGIRPENLHRKGEVPINGSNILHATCDVVEHMGSFSYLHLLCEGQKMTAQVGPYLEVKPGESLDIAVDMDKCHFFDKNSTRALR